METGQRFDVFEINKTDYLKKQFTIGRHYSVHHRNKHTSGFGVNLVCDDQVYASTGLHVNFGMDKVRKVGTFVIKTIKDARN